MKRTKFHDRGRMFSGYFITKADRPTKLFGVYWHHAYPAGTYINSKGVLRGITFFQFFDDDNDALPDNHTGRNHEQLDLNWSELDAFLTDPLLSDLVKGIPLTAAKKAKLFPEQLELVEELEEKGGIRFNRKLVGRKLLMLMPEFLGRTFNKAKNNKPAIWQPTTDVVTGAEVANIWKINLGPTVNS
jgi:hypothetical protein